MCAHKLTGMLVQKNVFNFLSYALRVCFPVNFQNSCLEYNDALGLVQIQFAQF